MTFSGSPVSAYNLILTREEDRFSFRTFERSPGKYNALLIFCDLSFFNNGANGSLSDISFLTGEEKKTLLNIKSEKRKSEFLGIRIILRTAQSLLNLESPEFQLDYGVFGQPFFSSGTDKGYEISVGHTKGVAVAVIFPSGQQIGTDIEFCSERPGRREAINSALTEKEIGQIISLSREISHPGYCLWSMKESLSKILKCGLTVPFSLLELSDLNTENGILSGFYSNFEQYRSFAQIIEKDYVLSITLPRFTKTNIEKTEKIEKIQINDLLY